MTGSNRSIASSRSWWRRNPRSDLLVIFILVAFVIGVAVVPYLIFLGNPLPGRVKFIEQLDLLLGPILIAGSVGFNLEDWLVAGRKNGGHA